MSQPPQPQQTGNTQPLQRQRLRQWWQQLPLLSRIFLGIALVGLVVAVGLLGVAVSNDIQRFGLPREGNIDKIYGYSYSTDKPLYITLRDVNVWNETATLDIVLEDNGNPKVLTATSEDTTYGLRICTRGIEKSANDDTYKCKEELDDDYTVIPNLSQIPLTNKYVVVQDKQVKLRNSGRSFPLERFDVSLYIQLQIHNNTHPYFEATTTYYTSYEMELIPLGKFHYISDDKNTKVINSIQETISRPWYVIWQVFATLLLMGVVVGWSFIKVFNLYVKIPGTSTGNLSDIDRWQVTLEIVGTNIGIILSIPDVRDWLVPSELVYAPLVDISMAGIICLSLLTLVLFIAKKGV